MREIKFRIYNKKSMKWIHGPGHEVSLFGEVILMGYLLDKVPVAEINDCVALQYTGVKDSNGVEIYEGDFLKDTWKENQPYGYCPDEEYDRDNVFEVGYIGHFFNVERERSDDQTYVESFYREIIGNIVDNPELKK
jgi:uncharacterized phage protein (TIGR01671 family)